jgi:hypothetical protein
MPDVRGFPVLRQAAVVAACLAVLLGCGAGGPGQGCSLVGRPSGVSLQVDAKLGTATTARLSVCQGTTCQDEQVTLTPATTAVPSSCSGDNCGAALEPTGGRSGFAALAVPAAPVKVTVKLFDATAAPLLEGTAEATARTGTAPCGGEGRQIALVVTPAGVTAS